LRSHPEVGRQRGGAKNPKSPTIFTTFPKIAALGRGQISPKALYPEPFPKYQLQREAKKSQKPYIHNLFLLSKIYNISLRRAKYRNWWKPRIQANALIKPVSDN
jgi:hypothetical protein